MLRWFKSSLNRKLAVTLSTALLSASALFLVVFLGFYWSELKRARSLASMEVNRLLQTSLENAMLKRDMGGLRDIVQRLGRQDGVSQVMIVNPAGEVRFASTPDALGRQIPDQATASNATVFTVNDQGREVLRSINVVRNKPQCIECHGPTESNPVNGVLLVDYEAGMIRSSALWTTMALVGSGSLVVLLALAGTGLFVRRQILGPIDRLVQTSHALADGDLTRRVRPSHHDELALLGKAFDEMADNLQASMMKIEEKEAFVQGVLDAIPDGVRVIAEDYTILKVNQAYRDQLGLAADGAINTPCYGSSHGRNSPCIPTLVTCPLHEIGKTGQPVKSIHQHIRADGTELQAEVVAAPAEVKLDGRKRRLVVESIRDLAKYLNVSHEQKLAEMAQLATGVAHEIHNPLASIRLALNGAQRAGSRDQPISKELGTYLEVVDRQIDKCIDVTERLLKLAVPPDEKLQLVSINPAISDTASLLAHEAKQLGVTLKLDLAPANPRVVARDSEVRVLVLNFLQNAFHAMPNGGLLEIASARLNGSIEIAVKDTGTGIPPEHVAHIFNPFFSCRADGKKGTGLGLTICKSIVDRYRGNIEVESRPQQGTVFRARLPSAD